MSEISDTGVKNSPSSLIREPRKEVLVDAAEDVAGNPFELVRVQLAQQFAEHLVVERLVLALGQDAAQAVAVGLDGFHGRDDGGRAVGPVGEGDEVVEPGLGPHAAEWSSEAGPDAAVAPMSGLLEPLRNRVREAVGGPPAGKMVRWRAGRETGDR